MIECSIFVVKHIRNIIIEVFFEKYGSNREKDLQYANIELYEDIWETELYEKMRNCTAASSQKKTKKNNAF